MLDGLLPDRPLAEQMAGYVTVTIDGHSHELPVLNRRANRAWKQRLNDELGAIIGGISAQNDPAAIFAALALADDTIVDLVRAYDHTGQIPADDDLADDTDREWLAALLACASAAYPFVGLAITAQRQQAVPTAPATEPQATPSGPEPTNGRRPTTAGAPTS